MFYLYAFLPPTLKSSIVQFNHSPAEPILMKLKNYNSEEAFSRLFSVC